MVVGHNGHMRAIVIESFGPPSVLQLQTAAVPQPAQGEVLVEVLYAGLNPLDYKMRDGSSGMAKSLELPAILGREFTGRIVHAGPDTDLGHLSPGQLVFGMRPHGDVRGCYAEQVVVDLDAVAPVPDGATVGQLPAFGGLALVGLTAIAAVEECARVQPGDRVLVHGGSGGVGQLVIPMALAAGASHVWATGRAANAERLIQLGAVPIPYDEVDWQDVIRRDAGRAGLDVIIDTHYFKTFIPSLDHVADGGRLVALPSLADLSPAQDRGIDASIPAISPTREKLDRLATGYMDGTLALEVSELLPLADVVRGHEQLEAGHTRGKLVLDLRN